MIIIRNIRYRHVHPLPSGYMTRECARAKLSRMKDTFLYAINLCIQDTLSSRVRLAFRPSARASKGILHTK